MSGGSGGGRYGKADNGIVTVTTVWADERVYYPAGTRRSYVTRTPRTGGRGS
ncbi:hypothetical protein Acsp02_93170 [Actinoplanes sp. NBRC 103695]|nr:hypothetical protein Acsp02_93170 [Actinoplanes sp. NBRC 103695]